ncbi:MAG: hypothetical protein K0S65_2313, partial [Labilithrix sp.]|nr:hypothetical protein [Labilithrix sp.]
MKNAARSGRGELDRRSASIKRGARSAFVGGLALASALPWVFASCAATDDGNVRPADASTVLETGLIDAGSDAEAGGCDASDLSCVPPVRC